MTVNLSPGIYFEEVPPAIRQIEGVSTTKIAAVGVTERGPIATPTRSVSWEEWVKTFGSYIADSDLPTAVFGAFQNGAREVVTVRVVHFTDITNENSYTATKASVAVANAGGGSSKAVIYSREKGPFELTSGQTLIFVKDGVTMPTLTLTGTRAAKTSSNTETQDMSGGKTLTVKVDDEATAQTITFVDADFVAPGAATAEEIAAVINAQIKGARAYDNGSGAVTIESDTLGTGSKIEVTGGDADTLWNWGASAVTGTGNVANILAVTVAELITLIGTVMTGVTVSDDGLGRLKIEHDTGALASTLQVDASSTADTPIGLDNNSHTGLDSAGTVGSKTSTLAAPWKLATGDTLAITTDLGGPTSATFTGTPASIESDAETYVMTGDPSMVIKFDDGPEQTINFTSATDFAAAGTATAEEVVEAANKQIRGGKFLLSSSKTKVTIQSDTGGKSSKVHIVSGAAMTALGLTAISVVGSGNVEDIDAVTFEEAKAIIEDAVVGVRCTQDSSSKMVLSRTDAGSSYTIDTPSGTALTKFAYTAGSVAGTTGSPATVGTLFGKTEGTYAAALTARVENATSGDSSQFNLKILKAGVLQEFWANLTMGAYSGTTPTDTRYIATILNHATNGSDLLSFTDALVVGTASDRRPANADYALTGGDDGLTSLDDNDYIGDSSGKNGIRALDTVNDISLLIIPGRATSAVQNAMLTYCETTRSGRIFAILDPPESTTYSGMQTYVKTTASLKESSEYGAIYWPEILVNNPNKTVFGNSDTITVPPSGHMAGVYVRNDLRKEGGIYTQPAGTDQNRGVIRGAVGVADKDVNNELVRDILYPDNINPIWAPTGQPLHADGSANLKRTSNFQSIAERRGVIFIEYSIVDGMAWVKHSNLGQELRDRVKRTILLFLLNQMKLGAFASKDPATAFYVDVGTGLNPPSQERQRKLNGRIGLATAAPAEFINFIISQDTRALDEEINTQLSL